MKATLTFDDKFIVISDLTDIERKQLQLSFTKKIPNWFIIKKKNPFANVDLSFINSSNMIPTGLWMELVNICKKFNFSLTFSSDFNCRIKNCEFNEKIFYDYISDLFKSNEKIKPENYQTKGIYNVLSYKNCCLEVSTSGGKTLMAYMLFKFLYDNSECKHVLYVVPNTNLATQSLDKFLKYDDMNNVDSNYSYSEIHSEAKKKKEYNDNIIFGTYQSLCKKKKEFFEQFDCVFIDECAHAKADSIKNILKKCVNAKYKVGVTGTFPKDGTYENFIIQSYIGPVIFKYSSYELINESHRATPVNVKGILLNYVDIEKKEALRNLRMNVGKDTFELGGKVLSVEKEVARNSQLRFKYICDLASKTTKNTLILFGDIQNGYGRKIYNHLKENTDKSVFYVDGGISNDYRDNAKQSMENDETGNTIIVASIFTFGEGIDISNLHNVILVESTKSDSMVGQIIGRLMRKHESKESAILIDIGDDFRLGNDNKKNNYLYKHFIDRANNYKSRGFNYESYYVNLLETNLF